MVLYRGSEKKPGLCFRIVNFFEGIGRLFQRKKKMRVRYKKHVSEMNDREYNAHKKNEQERINEILDKISRSGYESLTREEKAILFKAKTDFMEVSKPDTGSLSNQKCFPYYAENIG